MASDSTKSEGLLRRANKTDFALVLDLYAVCRKHMADLGLDQWQDGYPFNSIIVQDISDQTLWISGQEELDAAIVVNKGVDPQHLQVNWQFEGAYRFIHRFAVHPNYWGQGLAKRIMEAAEFQMRREGVKCVRLDTYSLNKRNLSFYEKLGYSRADGLVYFEPHEAPFICFEKRL